MNAIPALYDPKTSFGPYQFTEYALYDVRGERRGSSIPNQYLPGNHQLPGSVAQLRGLDHHKAASLFLLDNIANLVLRLTPKEFTVLKSIVSSKHPDILAYVATAYHGPAIALNIAGRWLGNGARLPYEISAGRAYSLYAKKTKSNLKAL